MRKRKVSFDAYDGFVARRVDVKVSFDDYDVMSFIPRYDLWGLKYYDVKLYGDVVLSMVRVKMVEWSPFGGRMRYLLVVYNDCKKLWCEF